MRRKRFVAVFWGHGPQLGRGDLLSEWGGAENGDCFHGNCGIVRLIFCVRKSGSRMLRANAREAAGCWRGLPEGLRRWRPWRLVVLGAACLWCGVTTGQDSEKRSVAGGQAAEVTVNVEDSEDWLDLLSGDLRAVWRSYPAGALQETGEEAAGERVWRVEEDGLGERVLICSGHPRGFLRTEASYGDFELRGEWRYLKDADGNSGFLVFTQAEERIWPTSVQIQLHQPKAGSIFPSGDAKTDNVLELEMGAAREPGQWNECRIVCRAGTVTMEMNGRRVGVVTGAMPSAGHVALQSEGAEVHFRRLRIRRLKS